MTERHPGGYVFIDVNLNETLIIKTTTGNCSPITVSMLIHAFDECGITPEYAKNVIHLIIMLCDFRGNHTSSYDIGEMFPNLEFVLFEDCMSGSLSSPPITLKNAQKLTQCEFRYNPTRTLPDGVNDRYFDLALYGLYKVTTLQLNRCKGHVVWSDEDVKITDIHLLHSVHLPTVNRIFESCGNSISTVEFIDIGSVLLDGQQRIKLPPKLIYMSYDSVWFTLWNLLDFGGVVEIKISVTGLGRNATIADLPSLPDCIKLVTLWLIARNPIIYGFLEKNKKQLKGLINLSLSIPFLQIPPAVGYVDIDVHVPFSVKTLIMRGCYGTRTLMPLISTWQQRRCLVDVDLDGISQAMLPPNEVFLARMIFTDKRQKMWNTVHALSNPGARQLNFDRVSLLPKDHIRIVSNMLGYDEVDPDVPYNPEWVAEYTAMINKEDMLIHVGEEEDGMENAQVEEDEDL